MNGADNEEKLIDAVSRESLELLAKIRAGTLTEKERSELEDLAALSQKIEVVSGEITEISQLSKEERMALGRIHARLAMQQDMPAEDTDRTLNPESFGNGQKQTQSMTPEQRMEKGRADAKAVMAAETRAK